ncbi:type I toxin-antitoxin system ptaRNA1 family toxin [Thalassotalea profundi]|nr:type I toxin-antitoxin system ptaRNA1 family toxin [Thalassotalea profundi]
MATTHNIEVEQVIYQVAVEFTFQLKETILV